MKGCHLVRLPSVGMRQGQHLRERDQETTAAALWHSECRPEAQAPFRSDKLYGFAATVSTVVGASRDCSHYQTPNGMHPLCYTARHALLTCGLRRARITAERIISALSFLGHSGCYK